jgi:hypothetical protein
VVFLGSSSRTMYDILYIGYWHKTGHARGSISGRGKRCFLHSVQTGSGAHPISFQMGTGALSPGVRRPGREVDHSPPYSVEVKNCGAITLLPHTSSLRGMVVLHIPVYNENFGLSSNVSRLYPGSVRFESWHG